MSKEVLKDKILNDNLPAIPVKVHSYKKLLFPLWYLPLFTVIMKEHFAENGFLYVDGFAGPGVNEVRGYGRIFGSPLLALRNPHPFTKYIFIDQDPNYCNALSARTSVATQAACEIINGDANVIIPQLMRSIRLNSHIFAFLDPRGLELDWTTVVAIAHRRYREMLINFSYAVWKWARAPRMRRKVCKVMGIEREWYGIHRDEFLQLYTENLEKLGFVDPPVLPVENEKGNIVYYLIFATRNETGRKLASQRMRELGQLGWKNVRDQISILLGFQQSLERFIATAETEETIRDLRLNGWFASD